MAPRAVCGQIREWRDAAQRGGEGSQAQAGDESLSSTGQGNEGMGGQPGIHPRQERRGSKDGNWLENLWGAALPAGNADLLIPSILQLMCVLRKPKYTEKPPK